MNIIHHATKEQVAELIPIFAKVTYVEHGELFWEVPEWLDVMYNTAQ